MWTSCYHNRDGTSGCCVAKETQQPDVWYRHIPAYTKCDVQLIKVAPDDGLIQSETCRAVNKKIKPNHKNFVHLVGLYTYCKMMHGAYNVKMKENLARMGKKTILLKNPV